MPNLVGRLNLFSDGRVDDNSEWLYGIVRHTRRSYNVPSTVPLADQPKLPHGNGPTIVFDRDIWEFIEKLNEQKTYDNWIRKHRVMLVNDEEGYDEDTPYSPAKTVSITCGGNYKRWKAEHSTFSHVKIDCYEIRQDFRQIDPLRENFFTMPYKIYGACIIKANGDVIKVGNAEDAFIPNIGAPDLWLDRADLEPFPTWPGVNFVFDGMDIYDGSRPIMTHPNGIRTYHDERFRLETKGIVPPKNWR